MIERDPMELEEVDIDLTREQQQRIDQVFDRLDESHYELLGVRRTADKKEIKRAYNELVAELHPDRFFRKRLGSFAPKVEAIVLRLGEAHDVLCSPERDRYDASLGPQQAKPPSPAEAHTIPPNSGVSVRHSAASSAADMKARREALARRLMSGARPAIAPIKPIGGAIAQLRDLHEKQKAGTLDAPERALYEALREDFARTLVAAQRLTLRPGQTFRQALRVPCARRLEVSLEGRVHKTTTLDLSTGGLSALLENMLPVGVACEIMIALEEPVRARARVVECARYGGGGSTFRVSLAFETLAPAESQRIETLVLDHALAAMKA